MQKVARQFNATRLNDVVNHPAVYPWVHGTIEGPLDFTPMISKDSPHINLMGEFGGCVFVRHQAGLYEVHTHILPAGRGEWAKEAVTECVHYIFTCTDAVEIWTRVPKGNYAARALVKAMGGTLQFRADRGWVIDGETVYADIFSMMIQDWMRITPSLAQWGEWFQRKLDAEYRRLGLEGREFDADESHNKYIGAAVEMIRHGQIQKGVVFYNRWALMSSCQPMTLINVDPVMLHIGEALVELHGSNFFISAVDTPFSH